MVKNALMDDENTKVVFILHSQGGIEGGLIVDWLLDEVPQDRLRHLEVYTFGCAANHFNNPFRSLEQMKSSYASDGNLKNTKAIRHIEHYANHGDFVSQFGVLNFSKVPNRFMGRVFE
ncbi:hypothetical protein LTS18_004667, partial [Coniosporium uncinatum]